MNYLLAFLILAGSLATALWLRRQQRRIEFDAHWDTVVDMLNNPDWTLWERQVSA